MSRMAPPGVSHAARFDADEAVLDEVEPAYAMGAAELVELRQQRRRRERDAIDGDGVAPVEVDCHILRDVGRLFRIDGAGIDIVRHFLRRVLEHLALGGGVQEIGVD